ncbi:GNAT family N-acetyltransferase [Nonomuraea rhodomycinica]|uniref:N-acetyltransferase family protein n=1 Tax=Nonomuraea rhodomycinica TaxID=1712872 RepID=A0A7Y6MEB6_9ACTN|nr:GNAT family N-acetyltransferase [Nonomuraea rhodomycinica]NUW45423.1 N-acetyltransferase family protein [Nonomuraea rhodomycinica]
MTTPRPLSESDLPAVASIYAHYVEKSVATFDETPPGVEDWRAKAAAITGAGLPFLVTEEDGEVTGFAYAGPFRPKPAYRHTAEDTVYLAPGATGRGLGRLLLGELIERAARAGTRQMVAVVADGGDSGNPASLRLHAAFGFEQVGRLRSVGFKHGRWIDTILLQRALDAPATP